MLCMCVKCCECPTYICGKLTPLLCVYNHALQAGMSDILPLLIMGCHNETQCELLGMLQAGGYFSIGVCITTWWLALAELVFDVTGKPYVPVFWYPWGGEQKMTAAMSSRRSLNPHVHQAIMNGSKKNLAVDNQAAMPTNGGNGNTIV